MTNAMVRNRVRKTIGAYRDAIEAVNPRPKDYPYNLGWSLAFDIEGKGDARRVIVTAWSVAPDMIRPMTECNLKTEPWTAKGQEFFDRLRAELSEVTGLRVDVTYVMGIWSNSGDEAGA